jgi:hypothetical protein
MNFSAVQGMDGDVIILQDLFSRDEKKGPTRWHPEAS